MISVNKFVILDTARTILRLFESASAAEDSVTLLKEIFYKKEKNQVYVLLDIKYYKCYNSGVGDYYDEFP